MKNIFKFSLILLAGASFVVLSAFRTNSADVTAESGFTPISAMPHGNHWMADPSHTSMEFSIKHMGISRVTGKFESFEGKMQNDSDGFEGANLSFKVDVNSINTGNEKRDGHLKSDDFFNAETYPAMKFVATSFKKMSEEKYKLKGNFTIRDVTKEVVFDVSYGGTVKDGYGNVRSGFSAKTTIDRFDYNLKFNATTETGGLVVGREVDIMVMAEMVKQ